MQVKHQETVPALPVPKQPHHLILEDGQRLSLTGVTRIISYDENGAALETQRGKLLVGGRDIQVSELSVQSGEMKISGQIEILQYAHPAADAAGGLLRRFLR